MKKRIIALLLAALMLVSLLAACSKAEPAKEDKPTAAQDSAPAKTEEKTDAPAKADEEPAAEIDPEDIAEINFWLLDFRSVYEQHGERIEAAVNEMTEPQGIHVNMTMLQGGDFQTVPTQLAGGEVVDVMTLAIFNSIANMHLNNMIYDLTDLLPEYAPEAYELMKPYIGPYTYDGRIYGMPTMRGYVTNGYIVFNGDELDRLGLREQAESMKSLSDWEAIMQAYRDDHGADGSFATSEGGSTMLASNTVYWNGDNFSDIEVTDSIGDSTGTVYTDKDGHIGLVQEQEGWIFACEKAKEWFDNGWMYPDGLYEVPKVVDLIKAGTVFCEICGAEPGLEVSKEAQYNHPAVCVKYYDGMVTTNTLTMWGIGVPITSEEPEAACRFINMLYTDSDLMNLLINGVEGADYELVDGQAKAIEGQYSAANWVYGNNLLALPYYGNGADYYKVIKEGNDAAECSPYLGFIVDTADLSLYITQISAVTDQYKMYMQCGAYTESDYNDYIDKLEDAGVRDYLAAVQEQLDAWLAANQ